MKSYFKLIILALGILVMFSCKKNDDTYLLAEFQLTKDYPNYDLSAVKWSTEYNYQIAKFGTPTKATATILPPMTVWYSISGNKATREMDTENLGGIIPNIIKAAFNATVYSNAELWIIDEVELENKYNGNGVEHVYEMELDSKSNSNLEAKLYFDKEGGALLFSKESLDDDNDDNDKFVVNQQLKDAVEKEYPGAVIIDAEIDGDFIEVEAIVTVNNKAHEIELLFTMTYLLVESELESKTTYEELAAKFSAVKAWFTENIATFPIPSANTEVEITEGNLTETDLGLNYSYGVEIDYQVGQTEYEVKFYLDANYAILNVKSEVD